MTESPVFVSTFFLKSRWQYAREQNYSPAIVFEFSHTRRHLLPGECRHIGSPRAPVAPIDPSVPLAFMCPLLASDSQPQTSHMSLAVGDDDFLSDGRSSFAWQVASLISAIFQDFFTF